MKETRRSAVVSPGFIFGILTFSVALFAIIIALASPLVSAIACGALTAVVAFALRPDLALIPYFLLAFLLPSYPVIDVVTVLLIAASIPAFRRKKRWDMVAQSPIFKPALFLLILAAACTFYGVFICENKVTFIYRDARVFVYWLFFIPLMAWAPDKAPHRWLFWMTILCGLIIAGLSVAQGVSGRAFISTGRVGDLDSISSTTISTIRVQIPGFVFVVFSIFAILSLYLNKEIKFFPMLLVFGFLMLGLIYNYGRALWFWTFIGMFVVAACYKVRGLVLFAVANLAIAVVAVPLLMQLRPDLLDKVAERVTSTFHEGGEGTSFGWREFELQKGLEALDKTFFAGIGIGGEYRRPLYSLAAWDDYPRYTHNGYLFLALKLSVLGPLVFVFLIGALVKMSVRLISQDASNRAIAVSCLAFSISFAGINTTQPEIMTHYGVLAFVFVAAVGLLAGSKLYATKL